MAFRQGPGVTEREGHVFVSNLLAADEDCQRPLMWVWQPDSMCERTPRSMVKQIEDNVFVRRSANDGAPLLWWSPVREKGCQRSVSSLRELEKSFPELFAHNQEFIGENITVFRNPALSNFHLVKEFHSAFKTEPLPAAIGKLLGIDTKNGYIGAYPPEQ